LKENLAVLVEQCDAVVALAEWYKTILLKNAVPEQKLHYIAQGLPTEEAGKAEFVRKTKLPIRLIFIGRIDPKKGLHILIKAIERLKPEMVELSIYGRPVDIAYERYWKKKTRMRSNILWKGVAQQQQVISLMRSHDLLCLCSTFSEMSPLVIQEAFAAGIPVMASDVYGNAEPITEAVNGWLFKFKDSHDLAKKLKMLIEQPQLIEEAKQKIPVVRRFNKVANEYETLYKMILPQ
jgi:glycosyltransferase involved in cell wall biosynthesis